MGSDGMPKTVWVVASTDRTVACRSKDAAWATHGTMPRGANAKVAEYRLVTPELTRALELAEAVAWIETREYLQIQYHMTVNDETICIVRDSIGGQPFVDGEGATLPEAVAALKAKIGEDGGR